MTTSPIATTRASGPPVNVFLPPELLDGITDAVISSRDSVHRAAVITRLVQEIFDSVAWLRSASQVDPELASLRRLLDEAVAHQAWLGTPPRSPLPFSAAS